MAHSRSFIAPLSRLGLSPIAGSRSEIPRTAFLPYQSVRCASQKSTKSAPKKKKTKNTYTQYDIKHAEQFSLVDAMQYIRAFEVGRSPSSSKYEMHVRLRTLKNGPVVRNQLRLPHPVKTDIKICVICPPDSKAAAEARAGGATLIGEDDVINQIKEGVINFDRCICHPDSLPKVNKAGLGRILGPRGLMPSTKTGTVVSNVAATLKNMVGASEYRERMGVIRMAVGQLGFTPEEMQRNIKTFMEALKKDIGLLSDRITKEIHEVVLSSTNSPGFSLSGEFRGPNSIHPRELSGPL
ncbi:ribosomal protein L1 [Westerdykella ornata]|uniref:Ribosomal protein L1 n=1 Tax=Westerdykella ornata TaxID=318751 RepID=A0A6A6JIX2_WESOR|nr:ribosomal protein L1 [Westerdykella ornata]KAF2276531.1 ribosomal protein L1 [Westerdykella ornata]